MLKPSDKTQKLTTEKLFELLDNLPPDNKRIDDAIAKAESSDPESKASETNVLSRVYSI